MNVLGINAFGTNPAACLLRDGKCVSFAEEERFTRVKVSRGSFPAMAAAYCLSSAGLMLDSIDRIAFGWDVTKYPWAMARSLGINYFRYKPSEVSTFHKKRDHSAAVYALECLMQYHPVRVRSGILEGLRAAGLKGNIPKVEFVPHHLAHAYSAYFCSGFNKAGILTMDGSGEDICTQLAVGEANDIRVIESFPIPHSLGWFYAAITEYLGFIPYRDEGKLMGLAALGEKRKNNNKWIEPLSRILKIRNDSYVVNPIYTNFGSHYYGKCYTDAMVKLITDIDPHAAPISYKEQLEVNGHMHSKYLLDVYVDIAWAAQELLERTAVMLAKRIVESERVKDLCIAGGVGLNCKMNGEILRRSGCDNIFIQPASSDAGTAMGAAMYVSRRLGEDVRNRIMDAYMGPGFSNDYIHAMLKQCGVAYKEAENPAEEAAHLLEEGKTIAWFQGRMEFGSRALGNRSILANPIISGIKDRVNSEAKYREPWRPFCPSIAEEAKEDYLEDLNEARFMTVAYHMKKSMEHKFQAVIHIDGSVRPQVVSRQANRLYHALISSLGRRTGHPVVLNTSFNVRSEPIICSPHEALRCFYSNGLDAAVLGNFILRKG